MELSREALISQVELGDGLWKKGSSFFVADTLVQRTMHLDVAGMKQISVCHEDVLHETRFLHRPISLAKTDHQQVGRLRTTTTRPDRLLCPHSILKRKETPVSRIYRNRDQLPVFTRVIYL